MTVMASSPPVSAVISRSRLLTQPPQSRYLLYSKGRTAVFACEADPRASFCLYIPSTHPVERLHKGENIEGFDSTFPLVVLIHHAGLNGQSLRDDWTEWAENHQCVILSPMFPYSFRGVSTVARNAMEVHRHTSSLFLGLDVAADVARPTNLPITTST